MQRARVAREVEVPPSAADEGEGLGDPARVLGDVEDRDEDVVREVVEGRRAMLLSSLLFLLVFFFLLLFRFGGRQQQRRRRELVGEPIDDVHHFSHSSRKICFQPGAVFRFFQLGGPLMG